MQPRQLIAVLVAFIVILAAALYVVSWSGDDDDVADTGDDTAVDDTLRDDATSSTTSTSTTTTSTTTTTIPTGCTLDPAGETTTTADPVDDDPDDDEEPPEVIVPTLGRNSSVTTVGLDTVTFGLTVRQAEEAAGTDMIPCEPISDCYRVTPSSAPEGISFLVNQGTIERVDIAFGPITTRSGVGIGTEESRIIELFGDSIEREVNDEGSVDLIFVPSDETDAQFRVVFTIREGVVETFRAGRTELVLDKSPCQA